MARKSPDLVAAVVISLAALAVTAGDVGVEAIRGPIGLLAVLLLPGYTLTAALFPDRGPALTGRPRFFAVGLIERAVLTLGMSLAIGALGGLLLNATPWGLVPISWASLLTCITVSAAAVAFRRRSNLEFPDHQISELNLVSPGPLEAVLLLVGVGLTSAAVIIAVIGAQREHFPGFTQMWIVPTAPNAVIIGVRNHEARSMRYRLTAHLGPHVLANRRPLTLARGQSWSVRLQLPSRRTRPARLLAVLGRAFRANDVYRRVSLDIPPNSS